MIDSFLKKCEIMSDMIDFSEKYNIVSYYQLVTYARYNRPDWHRTLIDLSYSGHRYLEYHFIKIREKNGLNV